MRWRQKDFIHDSLPKYLKGFTHTIAVMQTEEALAVITFRYDNEIRSNEGRNASKRSSALVLVWQLAHSIRNPITD